MSSIFETMKNSSRVDQGHYENVSVVSLAGSRPRVYEVKLYLYIFYASERKKYIFLIGFL